MPMLLKHKVDTVVGSIPKYLAMQNGSVVGTMPTNRHRVCASLKQVIKCGCKVPIENSRPAETLAISLKEVIFYASCDVSDEVKNSSLFRYAFGFNMKYLATNPS